jgi:hypothetical protein
MITLATNRVAVVLAILDAELRQCGLERIDESGDIVRREVIAALLLLMLEAVFTDLVTPSA